MLHLGTKMDRVTEIVNAAQELFSRYGFAKTTMTDIANRLEISKASLYYYFKDKEGIFKALAEKEQQQFVEELDKVMTGPSATRLKLLEYTTKRIELLQKMLTLSSLSRETFTVVRPLYLSILAEFNLTEKKLVKEILQQGIGLKEFEEINIDEHADFFISVLQGLRRVAFTKSENQETRIISANEYEQLKKQSAMFTEMFLHSISK